MKKVDYIIVGFGIAGVSLAEQLLQQDSNTFVVIDNRVDGATAASGGVLNPTVLKRFTAAWHATAFFEKADPFYTNLCKRLNKQLINPIAVHRIFKSVEEQNNWMVASDKIALASFLSSEIVTNDNPSITAPFGLGVVKQAAILQPKQLIEAFREFLISEEKLLTEHFDANQLQVNEEGRIVYKNISARHIIFAEGATVRSNPFFKLAISPDADKVFVGNKGEYVIFSAPALQLKEVLKGPVMIIPLGNDLYKVGASYGRDDFSTQTTVAAKEEIISKLKEMISCNFEVVDQVAGIRPTVKDRKPLLGSFEANKKVLFMNGLGTRGLSMAPLLAEWLLAYAEKDTPLPYEVDVKRFLVKRKT